MRPMRRRLVFINLVCVAVLGVSATFAFIASDALAWRARVVQAKLLGKLPELPLLDFLRWLGPRSPVYLGGLAHNPNVNSEIENPVADHESVDSGAHIYGSLCASCHGVNGRGKMGPNLISSVGHKLDWNFFSAVKWGVPGTAMVAQPLADRQIWETHAYLKQLARASIALVAPSVPRPRINIDSGSILASNGRPNEWLTFAGNYSGHRHTSLSGISKRNVRRLSVAWVAQLRSGMEFLESSPIVASGLVFVTESPDGVVALDATTGRTVWHFRRPVPSELPLCCGAVNRGTAILNDAVFVTTLDAYLVAIDASTGQKKWETKVADFRNGYSMTGAPLALADRIIVGVAGGEFGAGGFIAAYRASDGGLLWKFNTVPGPGEFGHDTWAGNSWKTGGALTWSTGAYDSKLNLLYWGVGNPAPTFSSKDRLGANLFSNSVVALDAESGTLRWHYQFTPGDEHDWDSEQQPVLAEIPWQGRVRTALLWANRNGFFYALDRQTGRFLFAKPFVKQTWAAGFTPEGQPILSPAASETHDGSLVSPSSATNWWPPSYDAGRKLMYVPCREGGAFFFASKSHVERGKRMFLGSASVFAANQPAGMSIKAIETVTGSVRWEKQLHTGADGVPFLGGVLSTDGGVLFAGYDEEFLAFDSDTGRLLWRINLGGRVNAPPIAYAVGRTQYIAVMAGNSLFTFSLPPDK